MAEGYYRNAVTETTYVIANPDSSCAISRAPRYNLLKEIIGRSVTA